MCAACFHFLKRNISHINSDTHTRKMPKAITANSYPRFVNTVKDDVSGVAKTQFHNVNKSSFAKLKVNTRQKKQYWRPSVVNNIDPDYIAQCAQEFEEHLDRMRQISYLMDESRLLDRISDQQPITSGPLIDRITSHTYDIPKSVPKEVHFRKTKIINREKEYKVLILATGERLALIQNISDSKELGNDLKSDFGDLMNNFDQFKEEFKSRVDRYTHKQWRHIKRDCIAVKRVPIANTTEQWHNICSEIAALGRQKCFIY